ncbi:hypothetical protein [Novacetimonas maltaceti]
MKNMPDVFRTASVSLRALPAFACSIMMTAAGSVLPHDAHAQTVAATTTAHTPAPSSPAPPVAAAVPARRENAEEYGPTPRSIQRPPNTPIPPSGVPLIPTAGLAPLSVAPISSPGDKTSFHKIELDALSHHEGLSGLLPGSVDALRDTDLEDPYYVPTAGTGHLVPQLGGLRSMLLNHGVSFAFTYKGEGSKNPLVLRSSV